MKKIAFSFSKPIVGLIAFLTTIFSINFAIAASPLSVWEVSGSNPNTWDRTIPYQISNITPGSAEYIEYIIKNVGSTAASFSVLFDNFAFSDPVDSISEPECSDEGGVWTSPNGPCTGRSLENLIDVLINYDLEVRLYDSSDTLIKTTVLYAEGDNITFDSLEGDNIFVSIIPAAGYIQVSHSFHLADTAGNAFQSDIMTFDMNMYVQAAVLGDEDSNNYNGSSTNNIQGKVLGAATGNDLATPVKLIIIVMLAYALIQTGRIANPRKKAK